MIKEVPRQSDKAFRFGDEVRRALVIVGRSSDTVHRLFAFATRKSDEVGQLIASVDL